MMRIQVLTVAALLTLGLVLTACSGDDDDSANGTGVPAVDAAIAAIQAGDASALAEQAVFNDVACTTADGLGGPPKCAPGQADGTEVSVLPAAACEGYYLLESEIDRSVEAFVSAENTVHGVYRSGGIAGFFPAGYVILLTVNDPVFGAEVGREVYVSEQGVTGLFFGCGQSAEDLIDGHGLTDEIT